MTAAVVLTDKQTNTVVRVLDGAIRDAEIAAKVSVFHWQEYERQAGELTAIRDHFTTDWSVA